MAQDEQTDTGPFEAVSSLSVVPPHAQTPGLTLGNFIRGLELGFSTDKMLYTQKSLRLSDHFVLTAGLEDLEPGGKPVLVTAGVRVHYPNETDQTRLKIKFNHFTQSEEISHTHGRLTLEAEGGYTKRYGSGLLSHHAGEKGFLRGAFTVELIQKPDIELHAGVQVEKYEEESAKVLPAINIKYTFR
ncbi:MAG: hypothetical protein K9G62_08235 [Alphaproteobacteria bacterium]|nr:hypothetical protein [Alphaproteobacteria bacterium]